jgi:hypothetical protein
MDIKNAAGLLEFRREDPAKPWKLYRGDAALPTDDKAVQGVVTLLNEKGLVKSFPTTTNPTELGLNNPSAVVSLWVDGVAKDDEKKAEDKKDDKKGGKPKLKADKPTVRLTFDAVQDKLVAVKREAGDDTALLRVPEHVLDRLKEGALAYMDKELPRFNTLDPAENVTKLTLVRGGVTTEVTRDAKAPAGSPPAWKITKPEAQAGRAADPRAVEDILRTLNNLRPTRLVAEKPDPAVLEKDYGLKAPALKAVVTLTKDGKETNWEYDFGRDAPEGAGVYAKQGDRDLVFLVDKSVLATVGKELQDPAVFHFEADKVKALKLTGWKGVLPAPTTYEFERQAGGSQWSGKGPGGPVPVDASKVRKLLDDLANLRAEKFVSHQATPKERDDNGLSPDKGALVVEVTVEGEKEPFQVTVGNLDPEKAAYFATSNRLPNELFKVRKDIFEAVKDKPASLSP